MPGWVYHVAETERLQSILDNIFIGFMTAVQRTGFMTILYFCKILAGDPLKYVKRKHRERYSDYIDLVVRRDVE